VNALRKLTLAIGLATALTMAGCSSDGDKSGSTTPTEQVLRIGQTSGVTQLDPNTTTFSAERVLWNLLWDGLTAQAESGEVVPALAESWETSPDQLTWTFHLRQGVTYHDGRAFVADDAAKTITRVLDEKVGSPQRSKITMVTGVEAVDESTLKVTLETPAPQLPAALIDIKMTDPATLADINKSANGTGPFRLVSFTPDQEVVVERNPDYYGAKPSLSKVQVTKYADTTSAQTALSSDAIDMMWGVPYDQMEDTGSADYVAVVPVDPAQAAVFEIDNMSPPFSDVRARQALSYATDREAIQAAAYGGLGVVNSGSTLISPNSPYASKSVTDYSYDLDKAKALFAEAGVADGDKLTCWATAGAYPEFATTCQILQGSLAKIGIKLVIETNETSTWAEKFYPAGQKYPATIVTDLVSREAPPLPFVMNYFGKDGWSEGNWPGTAAFEEAKKVIQRSTDDAELKQAFVQAQDILSTEQPVISILNVAPAALAQPYVKGAWVEPSGTTRVETVSFEK
jgi:peptide/nickel transport system substrate-binding protein